MFTLKRLQDGLRILHPRGLPLDDPQWTSATKAVWIGGCGRSGTTLLRVMLGAHSALYAGPELNVHVNLRTILERMPALVPRRAYQLYDRGIIKELSSKFDVDERDVVRIRDASGSLAEFVDRFLTEAAHKHGKERWIEKTPKNIEIVDYLFRHFPSSYFIHMIRDGRDVACSLRHHPKYMRRNGVLVRTNISNSIESCIDRWVRDVNLGLAHRDDKRYMEVRYFSLLDDTRGELEKICDFIGVPFEEQMLSYDKKNSYKAKVEHFKPSERALKAPDTSRVGRWQKDLSYEEACTIEERAGSLLRALGYTKDGKWVEALRHPELSENSRM
ncbi:MAG: sulfotransferase [bacterium]|nr:sulfotransferase [bacterium]